MEQLVGKRFRRNKYGLSILQTIISEGTAKTLIDKWSNYVIPGYEQYGKVKEQDDWEDIIKEI